MYNGGRKPIEEVESRLYALTLEQYMEQLGRRVDYFSVTERSFFRLHRIASTGWPNFLFAE
jgi:hypothetical protein